MQDLTRHTAIITGASSGIGEAIARRFAARGARLVLAARRVDRLEALAGELTSDGAQVMIRPTDVTNEDDVIGLFAEAEAFSPVTLLVANAGVASHGPTVDLSLDDWRTVMEINLTATFLCGREALRVMQPRGHGRIITVGSISAQMPRADAIAYNTSKYALEGMTRSFALDGRQYGITASIVHPGSTISEIAGEKTSRAEPSDKTMEARHVADLVATMAAVPDEINVLTATILPIAQPYLGRG